MTSNISSAPRSTLFFRTVAWLLTAAVLLYLLDRYLVYGQQWPSLTDTLDFGGRDTEVSGLQWFLGLLLYFIDLSMIIFIFWSVRRTDQRSLRQDAQLIARCSAYLVRAAFWSVLLIGLADTVLSFMRIEAIAPPSWVSQTWWTGLEQAHTRGMTVHYPLMALSFVIAFFNRSLGFIWLAVLVVFAEFAIVLSRFIFSYEQAFMGDLVRFWYAALFLFASAYTLVEDGHVRVDIIYTHFSRKTKAWVNALGSLLLGLPLCWVIFIMGMGTPQSSLIAPVLSFEISQSAYGMYVQYLMAGFLIIFALSMALIFISYFLDSVADLSGESDRVDDNDSEATKAVYPERDTLKELA